MTAPATELRAQVIAALKADTGVRATALGAAPRIYNRAPPEGDTRSVFPYLVVRGVGPPWDTDTESGAEITLLIHALGEKEGDSEGEDIFFAVRKALRRWAPRVFSSHRLANLVLQFEDITADEGGKRYAGLQRWRAVTEEL